MKEILLILLITMLISGCTILNEVKETKELMGTAVTITVLDEDLDKAREAVEAGFEEISRIDRLLSNYNNESEVYLLNKQGHIENPSEELILNMETAKYFGNLSQGAFDITVQPILDLYKHSFQELGRPPSEEEINKTLILVDYNNIFTKEGLILLRAEGMKITLGGITKGYAVDKAVEVLVDNGITRALVNAGGDVRAVGSKGSKAWQIALQNPRDKSDYITIIPIVNSSVTTSGDYERYFDDSKKFHHIVDPRSGYSATSLISVTIIAKEAMDADALATSVFVLGPEEGLELIEKLDGVEGLLITKDKEIIKSSGFGY